MFDESNFPFAQAPQPPCSNQPELGFMPLADMDHRVSATANHCRYGRSPVHPLQRLVALLLESLPLLRPDLLTGPFGSPLSVV